MSTYEMVLSAIGALLALAALAMAALYAYHAMTVPPRDPWLSHYCRLAFNYFALGSAMVIAAMAFTDEFPAALGGFGVIVITCLVFRATIPRMIEKKQEQH